MRDRISVVDATKFIIKMDLSFPSRESTVPAAKRRGQAQASPEHVGT